MQFNALAWPSRTKRVPQERHLVKSVQGELYDIGDFSPLIELSSMWKCAKALLSHIRAAATDAGGVKI